MKGINRMEYKDKIITSVAEKVCIQVTAKVIKSLRVEKKGLLNIPAENRQCDRRKPTPRP
jgi:hypothetical protein